MRGELAIGDQASNRGPQRLGIADVGE